MCVRGGKAGVCCSAGCVSVSVFVGAPRPVCVKFFSSKFGPNYRRGQSDDIASIARLPRKTGRLQEAD